MKIKLEEKDGVEWFVDTETGEYDFEVIDIEKEYYWLKGILQLSTLLHLLNQEYD